MDEKGLDFEAVRRLAAIEIFKEIEDESYGNPNDAFLIYWGDWMRIKKKFGVG